jgi:hypothetical protein
VNTLNALRGLPTALSYIRPQHLSIIENTLTFDWSAEIHQLLIEALENINF